MPVLARQTVFARSGEPWGYELRLPESAAAGRPPAARFEAVLRGLFQERPARVHDGFPVVLRATPDLLSRGFIDLLDPARTLLDLGPSGPGVSAINARLRAAGFQTLVSLDAPHAVPPVPGSVDWISVDLLRAPPHRPLTLRSGGTRVFARGIATEALRVRALDAGCELLQGYHLARAEVLAGNGWPGLVAAAARLLTVLARSDAHPDPDRLLQAEPAIRCYLLGRTAGARPPGSADGAVHTRAALRREISMVLAAACLAERPRAEERFQATLQRGRMCEIVGEASGGSIDPSSLFLAGVLSALGDPAGELARSTGAEAAVVEALTRDRGPIAPLLHLGRACEEGGWDRIAPLAAAAGVSALQVPDLHVQSLQWSRERTRSHRNAAPGTEER